MKGLKVGVKMHATNSRRDVLLLNVITNLYVQTQQYNKFVELLSQWMLTYSRPNSTNSSSLVIAPTQITPTCNHTKPNMSLPHKAIHNSHLLLMLYYLFLSFPYLILTTLSLNFSPNLNWSTNVFHIQNTPTYITSKP